MHAEKESEVLGETSKVLGYAAYGSLYYSTESTVMINDLLFKKLSEPLDGMYEIEMSKKVISLAVPVEITFCILS